MKRLTLILGAAAIAAISAPTSARAQNGCSWWDLTCNGLASAVTDYGWHLAGRDQAGNVIYLRRVVDSNGNVVFEQARRDPYGRYVIMNNHQIRRGTVYGPNGEICKYNSNSRGYNENCKYAKASKVYNTRYEPARVNPVHYEAPKVHTVRYKAPKAHPVEYRAPAVHRVEYNAPKGHQVEYKAPKVEGIHSPHGDVKAGKAPEGKDEAKAAKGPKH